MLLGTGDKRLGSVFSRGRHRARVPGAQPTCRRHLLGMNALFSKYRWWTLHGHQKRTTGSWGVSFPNRLEKKAHERGYVSTCKSSVRPIRTSSSQAVGSTDDSLLRRR